MKKEQYKNMSFHFVRKGISIFDKYNT